MPTKCESSGIASRGLHSAATSQRDHARCTSHVDSHTHFLPKPPCISLSRNALESVPNIQLSLERRTANIVAVVEDWNVMVHDEVMGGVQLTEATKESRGNCLLPQSRSEDVEVHIIHQLQFMDATMQGLSTPRALQLKGEATNEAM